MKKKMKVVSKKFIKPSSPTPDDLRNFQISYTDEMAPTMMGPMIFYYPYCNINTNCRADVTNNFKLSLETSLAQVLTKFYPLAGRYIKESRLVDCSDQGAQYLEAEVDYQLIELLGPGMKPDQLNDLLPCAFGAADEVTDPILQIQANEFLCGGIAIAICISHRIADAFTASTFMLAWANASLGKGGEIINPSFCGPSFFPGRNLHKHELGVSRNMDISNGPKIVTRRFVFNGETISSIRAKVINSKYQPTRVQLISGLILRALLGVYRAKYGQSRASLILQIVNFRDRTCPPLPKHSCGNFCVFARAQCTAEESNSLDLGGCTDLLGDAVKKTIADCGKILNSGQDGDMIIIKPFNEITEMIYKSGDQLNVILLNSWCRLPLYEADFGWGKPAWVSMPSPPARNSVILMDTREGNGIEAWVILEEEDMSLFQQDQDIKSCSI